MRWNSMLYILPPSTIITFPGKMPAIIWFSGTGNCEGNDFARATLKGGRSLAGMVGGHQVEKSLYGLVIEGS
jgi:hypothetical protein